MKRILCLLLVVLMVGALLVSCGDEKKPTNNGGNTGGGGGGGGGETTEKNWWDDTKYYDTTITIQLSTFDDQELSNGSSKYMKGPDAAIDSTEGFDLVQNEVLKRNDAAKAALGLKVKYTYLAKDWGAGISTAIKETEASKKTPDMYCDQMYDMAGLSYQNNIFTNILKYTQTNRQKIDGWKGGWFHITAANGYNVNLMKDMALSTDKQFLIASDYYMEVMRAMLVMPFNLGMYENHAVTTDKGAAQLYQLVKEGKWTWDQMATYAGVYNGTGAKASIKDDRMLMALSISGLSAVGFVYSSGFQNYKEDKGKYILDDQGCQEIVNAFKSASDISKNAAVACGDETRGQPAGINTCKEVFTSGHALFAGPTMLGAVEETSFQSMNNETNRLSILPMPKNTIRSTYNTTINTRARVGAISFHSANKEQISAWIQYCTEKSDVVKTAYFDTAMNSKFLAGSGASEMLDMVYKNVGDNKSMVLDHLIMYKDGTMEQYTWTKLILDEDFQGHASDINTQYQTAVQAKQTVLDAIMELWKVADAA